MELFSIRIMPDHMSQSTHCKNWRACLDILNHPPYSPDMAAFRLISISVDGTLTLWKEFRQFERYQKSPGRLFCLQARRVLQIRHRKVTWIAEGSRKQWTLCDRLKIYLSLKNWFFNFRWKTERPNITLKFYI